MSGRDDAALAALHAACFTLPPPWSAADFAGLRATAGCFLIEEPAGFLLGRVIADEAELLTLAVDPAARRQGCGAALVATFLAEAAARGAVQAFLEVAAGNAAARALYARAGFAEVGRRRGYYRAPGQPAEDAIVMSCAVPSRP